MSRFLAKVKIAQCALGFAHWVVLVSTTLMNTHFLTLLHWSLAKLRIAAMEGERSSLPCLIPNQRCRNLSIFLHSRRPCCCRLRINNKIMHAASRTGSVHVRWSTGDSSPNEMWSSSCDDPIIKEAEQLTSTEEIKGSNYSKKPQRKDTFSYNNHSNPTLRWRLALTFFHHEYLLTNKSIFRQRGLHLLNYFVCLYSILGLSCIHVAADKAGWLIFILALMWADRNLQ